MHKAKHIASYYNLFPKINPSFSYCNRVSLFFYYTLYINYLQTTPNISTLILLHKIYFPSLFYYLPVSLAPFFVRLYVALFPPLEQVRGRFSSSFLYLPVRLAPSFLRLYVAVVPPLEEASESWVCVRGRFSSSFLYLLVRLAPSFVRLLFVFCSSFVRLLFVFCSSFL